MRKEAAVEKVKLKAAFYNNLAVGLFLGGFLIPYLTIARHLGSIVERLTNGVPLTFAETANTIAIIVAIVLAFTGARKLRKMANATIDTLEDHEPQKDPQ